jgi:hypothetical protein
MKLRFVDIYKKGGERVGRDVGVKQRGADVCE